MSGGLSSQTKRRQGVLLAWLASLLLAIWLPASLPALAQEGVNIRIDRATVQFPIQVDFFLQAYHPSGIEGVILHYGTNGRTCLSSHAQQRLEFEPGPRVDLTWEWELKRSGALPPQAEIWWQWEIVDADGEAHWTDRQTLVFADPRYEWRTITQGPVTLYWFEGDQAFGQFLVNLAISGLERLEAFTGVQPDGPINLIVYPSAEHVRDVLIHTYEWTGGVALSAYNTTILGIAPSERDWAARVIPHELSHLVTGAATFNCQGVQQPTWLNEGLAEYAEGPLPEWRMQLVVAALEEDRLPPLRSLSRRFPGSSGGASLSYAQSAAVVHYLVSEFGAEKVNDLLAALQSGQAIEPALGSVYGFDTDGLENRWRVSLGHPERVLSAPPAGAQGDPTPVPTLSLWTPSGQGTAPPSVTPEPTPAPATPTATPVRIVKSQTHKTIARAQVPDRSWIWIALGTGGGAALAVALVLLRKEGN